MKRIIQCALLVIVTATMGAVPAQLTEAQAVSCLVTTASGDIQGLDRGASCAFLGVPYAAPPVGNLRWKAPEPAAAWAPAVVNATQPPSICPQINLAGLPAGSEDCLRLNVWTRDPKPSRPAPVIVWLHPGSFVAASANFANHNGQSLVERTGVIVVTPNYRLGPFGFLAHPALRQEDPAYNSSGNYGMLDQRAALAWLRDNIAAFGGDPNNVTLAGTSSGGHSVGLHLISPRSAGLFHRAIMQSGYASVRTPERAEVELQGVAFAVALGCADAADVPACMRLASRNNVLLALPVGAFEYKERPPHWVPHVDSLEIPDQPRTLFEAGAFVHVPVMLGATRDEGWTWVDRSFPVASFPDGITPEQFAAALETEFGQDAGAVAAQYSLSNYASPKDALARLTGDAEYTCEATRVARLIERTGTPVYLYSFEYEVEAIVPDRVVHGLEGNFVFKNNFGPPLIASYPLSPEDEALAVEMGGYWTRFAASGNPNSEDPDVVHWPAFKHPTAHTGRGTDKYLILDKSIREAQRRREAACAFWSAYFFRSLHGPVPASLP